MNRRAFITKTLVAVAVVPLVGKLVKPQHPLVVSKPPHLFPIATGSEGFRPELPDKVFRPVTITLDARSFSFLKAGFPLHGQRFTLKDLNGDHECEVVSVELSQGTFDPPVMKISGAVVSCRDPESCRRLGCFVFHSPHLQF